MPSDRVCFGLFQLSPKPLVQPRLSSFAVDPAGSSEVGLECSSFCCDVVAGCLIRSGFCCSCRRDWLFDEELTFLGFSLTVFGATVGVFFVDVVDALPFARV